MKPKKCQDCKWRKTDGIYCGRCKKKTINQMHLTYLSYPKNKLNQFPQYALESLRKAGKIQ